MILIRTWIIQKKVVSYAHERGVTVEAELGKVGGAEASEHNDAGYKTKPEDVAVFVEKNKSGFLGCCYW